MAQVPNHKSKTRAVKDVLKKAGIEAENRHRRGTAWGWLEIQLLRHSKILN